MLRYFVSFQEYTTHQPAMRYAQQHEEQLSCPETAYTAPTTRDTSFTPILLLQTLFNEQSSEITRGYQVLYSNVLFQDYKAAGHEIRAIQHEEELLSCPETVPAKRDTSFTLIVLLQALFSRPLSSSKSFVQPI